MSDLKDTPQTFANRDRETLYQMVEGILIRLTKLEEKVDTLITVCIPQYKLDWEKYL